MDALYEWEGALRVAAAELKRDRALSDPSDDDVLIAAAELTNYHGDLAKLSPAARARVVRAYDTERAEV